MSYELKAALSKVGPTPSKFGVFHGPKGDQILVSPAKPGRDLLKEMHDQTGSDKPSLDGLCFKEGITYVFASKAGENAKAVTSTMNKKANGIQFELRGLKDGEGSDSSTESKSESDSESDSDSAAQPGWKDGAQQQGRPVRPVAQTNRQNLAPNNPQGIPQNRPVQPGGNPQQQGIPQNRPAQPGGNPQQQGVPQNRPAQPGGNPQQQGVPQNRPAQPGGNPQQQGVPQNRPAQPGGNPQQQGVPQNRPAQPGGNPQQQGVPQNRPAQPGGNPQQQGVPQNRPAQPGGNPQQQGVPQNRPAQPGGNPQQQGVPQNRPAQPGGNPQQQGVPQNRPAQPGGNPQQQGVPQNRPAQPGGNPQQQGVPQNRPAQPGGNPQQQGVPQNRPAQPGGNPQQQGVPQNRPAQPGGNPQQQGVPQNRPAQPGGNPQQQGVPQNRPAQPGGNPQQQGVPQNRPAQPGGNPQQQGVPQNRPAQPGGNPQQQGVPQNRPAQPGGNPQQQGVPQNRPAQPGGNPQQQGVPQNRPAQPGGNPQQQGVPQNRPAQPGGNPQQQGVPQNRPAQPGGNPQQQGVPQNRPAQPGGNPQQQGVPQNRPAQPGGNPQQGVPQNRPAQQGPGQQQPPPQRVNNGPQVVGQRAAASLQNVDATATAIAQRAFRPGSAQVASNRLVVSPINVDRKAMAGTTKEFKKLGLDDTYIAAADNDNKKTERKAEVKEERDATAKMFKALKKALGKNPTAEQLGGAEAACQKAIDSYSARIKKGVKAAKEKIEQIGLDVDLYEADARADGRTFDRTAFDEDLKKQEAQLDSLTKGPEAGRLAETADAKLEVQLRKNKKLVADLGEALTAAENSKTEATASTVVELASQYRKIFADHAAEYEKIPGRDRPIQIAQQETLVEIILEEAQATVFEAKKRRLGPPPWGPNDQAEGNDLIDQGRELAAKELNKGGNIHRPSGGSSEVLVLKDAQDKPAFAFKSARGESSQMGLPPGGGAIREAVSSKVTDAIFQQTGYDFGFPKSTIATIDGKVGALVEGLQGKLLPASDKVEFDDIATTAAFQNAVPGKELQKTICAGLATGNFLDLKWDNVFWEKDQADQSVARPFDAGAAFLPSDTIKYQMYGRPGGKPPRIGADLLTDAEGNPTAGATQPMDAELVAAMLKIDVNALEAVIDDELQRHAATGLDQCLDVDSKKNGLKCMTALQTVLRAHQNDAQPPSLVTVMAEIQQQILTAFPKVV